MCLTRDLIQWVYFFGLRIFIALVPSVTMTTFGLCLSRRRRSFPEATHDLDLEPIQLTGMYLAPADLRCLRRLDVSPAETWESPMWRTLNPVQSNARG